MWAKLVHEVRELGFPVEPVEVTNANGSSCRRRDSSSRRSRATD